MVKTAITVAYGDGIGPEIMEASLDILQKAGAKLDIETIEIGEAVYKQGHSAGITPAAWESLRRTKVFYKSPITTPQGGGYKSLNVTIRKTLGLFANVRPCVSLAPYIATKHPQMDVVIVRENEEDLYAGIEHRQTEDVYQCLKLVSRPGCEKIIRYAFEYARAHGRKKVTCFTKDNIMKLTDGLFHTIFDQISQEYPDLAKDHWIIDIGAAKLADTPEEFDVIVTLNLYGDIISDIAAQITGSVGLAGSANIGPHMAMFEAIHGSAPTIAGQGLANPSGLLLSGVMMLVHLGQGDVAQRIHNAWLKTIEAGLHTADIYQAGVSKERLGTKAFAQAVIDHLGQLPTHYAAVSYANARPMQIPTSTPRIASTKNIVGLDLFVEWAQGDANALAAQLQTLAGSDFELQMITNRGVKVWPEGHAETFTTDHWRCRFMGKAGSALTHKNLADLVARAAQSGIDFIKTENLCTFNGKPGFSLGQGQ
jgi:isocitrate dehydrogenase